MAELLSVLLAFPTVVFTVGLGLALLYWMSVIVGAADIDLLGSAEGLDGAVDGAVDGAIDGAIDGAVDGAIDGAVDGALDGAAEGADGLLEGADGAEALDGAAEGAEGAKVEAASGILHALNLRRAPVTVVFSLVIFIGWIFSYTAVVYLGPLLGAVMPSWLFGILVLAASLALALPLTSWLTKPLEKIFKSAGGKSASEFVGSVCRVRTGRVDDKVGQAELEDGAAGLIIQVRDDGGSLTRGDEALIIDYDREREVYLVEAYDAVVKQEAG